MTNPPVQQVLPFELRKPFDGTRPAGLRLGHDRDAGPLRVRRHDAHGVRQPAAAQLRPRPPHAFLRGLPAPRHGRRPNALLAARTSGPGATLDCAGNARHRRLAAGAGEALVRPKPVVVQGPPGMGAGFTVAAQLRLPSAGRWELSLQYASPQRITVSDRHRHGLAARAQPRPARAVLARRRAEHERPADAAPRAAPRPRRAVAAHGRQPVRAARQDRRRAHRRGASAASRCGARAAATSTATRAEAAARAAAARRTTASAGRGPTRGS